MVTIGIIAGIIMLLGMLAIPGIFQHIDGITAASWNINTIGRQVAFWRGVNSSTSRPPGLSTSPRLIHASWRGQGRG
jgi:hypothetical protein